MTQSRPPHLLSVPEAARHVGVSEPAIRAWIERGWLPAQKVSGRYVIDRSDLDAAAAHVAAGHGGDVHVVERRWQRRIHAGSMRLRPIFRIMSFLTSVLGLLTFFGIGPLHWSQTKAVLVAIVSGMWFFLTDRRNWRAGRGPEVAATDSLIRPVAQANLPAGMWVRVGLIISVVTFGLIGVVQYAGSPSNWGALVRGDQHHTATAVVTSTPSPTAAPTPSPTPIPTPTPKPTVVPTPTPTCLQSENRAPHCPTRTAGAPP